jgi:hypothetical protein
VLALLFTGCLRLDVAEGGRVEVEPLGTGCSPLEIAPPDEPERLQRSCHLFLAHGVPTPQQVTLRATPEPGFVWRGWHGAPAECEDSSECSVWVDRPLWIEARFEPAATSFTPDAIHVGVDGIAYLPELAAGRIHRFSLARRLWLVPLEIPSDIRFSAYSAADRRLLLASATGTILALEPAVAREPRVFVERSIVPTGLTVAGRFLVVADARNGGTHATFDFVGAPVDARLSRGSASDFAWSAASGRLYHTAVGPTRTDLLWAAIHSGTGMFTSVGTTPYGTDFPTAAPLRISPADARLLIGTGDVYDGHTLKRLRSLAVQPVDALWSGDGLLVLAAGPAGSRLEQRGGDFALQDVVPFAGTPLRVLANGDAFEVVTLHGGRPVFHRWHPTLDGDADGVPFAQDHFPLDPAASLDSDADGYPDAWNAGADAADSTTGLALDAFPDRSSCRVAADATLGVCDAEALRPAYTPQAVAVDANGIVYALGAAHRRIDRWAPDGQLLDPIRLGGTPLTMMYAAAAHRLLIANADRSLTAVDLSQVPRERHFGGTPVTVRALAEVGTRLLSIGTGSWVPWILTFDASGVELAESRPPTYDWPNGPTEFSSSTQSPRAWGASGGTLSLLELDATQAATVRRFQLQNLPPFTSVAPPVRVSADAKQVFAGPRVSFETKYNTLLASFAGTAVDATWLDHGLVTLQSVAGSSSRVVQWGPTGLQYAEASFPGTPLRVLRSGAAVAVLALEAGRVRHAFFAPTPDADGDGVANAVDDFPTDAAASQDADGDRAPDAWNPGSGPGQSTTGLVLDAFPDFADCWLPSHERNGTCDFGATIPTYTPAKVEIDRDGVVYLLSPQHRRIFRWSLQEAYHLEPIRLPETPVDFAYVPDTHRVHVVYKDGLITSIEPAARLHETPFALLPSEPFMLMGASRFLMALHRRDFTSTPPWRSVLDESGALVEQRSAGSTAARHYYSEASRGYFMVTGGSPADVVWIELDPETGLGGTARSSPYHGDYGMIDPVRVSPDGARVLLGTGDIYDPVALTIRESLTIAPADAHWLEDGLVTIRAGASGSTRLERWSGALGLEDFATVPGTPLRVLGAGDRYAVVTLSGGRPQFREYVPTDDADGDTVANTADAFPEDPSASADTDRDGWPDTWNPGRGPGDSTSGLALDAFPQDSACQLPQHGSGGVCDVALATPAYRADQVVESADGTLHLLSTARARIERYDPVSGTWLNPIVTTAPQPMAMAYSPAADQLYVGHQNGLVDRFELASELPPERYTVTPGRVFALTAADPFVVIADVDARQYLHAHAPDGRRLGRFRDEPYYQTRPVWDALHRRVYFSAGDFYIQEILPDGTLGVRARGPYSPTAPMGQPIRLDADAMRVFLGPDGVFDLATLVRQRKLDTTVVDAVWLGNQLLTLESVAAGQSRMRLYDASYRIDIELPFAGEPIALHEHAGIVSVVVYSGGDTEIHSFPLPADGDGDGVPNEQDAFPIDPAASRDFDGDGFPGLWNPGYTEQDSTTGLRLDAFPSDYGCWLAEHGFGNRCDVEWVVPVEPELPLCFFEQPLPEEPNGILQVEAIDELIPVCGGWLFVADPVRHRIELRNTFDGWRLGRTYPLPGATGDMELDVAQKKLYATLTSAHAVAVIDLSSSEMTLVPLPEETIALTHGANGDAFVSTRAIPYSTGGRLFRIPAGAGEAEGGWPIPALRIRYSPAQDEILVIESSGSPTWLRRFGFDATGALTLLQERRNSGGDVSLSPSGHEIAIPGGSGYGVEHLDAADLDHVYGRFETDAYPISVAFSPDGATLAASNVDSLILFDVAGHQELSRHTPGSCWLDFFNDVSFEPSGELVFSRQNCTPTSTITYTLIHWLRAQP